MDVLGLPLHPLVVHAAVVFVPLAAVAALLVAFWPTVRTRHGWLVVGLVVVAAGSALAARLSGQDFIESMGGGTPAAQAHTAWGLVAPFPAIALAVSVPALVWLDRRRGSSRPLRLVLVAVTVLSAAAALVLIGLTGHSGATAVWAP
ncbi:hypothetical protein FOJ82_10905 [Tessaracoccus rhinocerotis]|uniref:DUF2231 domain-containing protein n=1 Tax=Tessaracoccus rhinocerotis TaxID=1689449 RepID=A0A553JZD3_9ACTN|nr:hypothetical protein FOJ82_10905 [Tessaracoccus rhinocerotis]